MKCINKECPCGLYNERVAENCEYYMILSDCPSYKPEEKKKRELTVRELLKKGARFIHTESCIVPVPIVFAPGINSITWGACSSLSTISECIQLGHKWSTDAIHVQSFEVEE